MKTTLYQAPDIISGTVSCYGRLQIFHLDAFLLSKGVEPLSMGLEALQLRPWNFLVNSFLSTIASESPSMSK